MQFESVSQFEKVTVLILTFNVLISFLMFEFSHIFVLTATFSLPFSKGSMTLKSDVL